MTFFSTQMVYQSQAGKLGIKYIMIIFDTVSCANAYPKTTTQLYDAVICSLIRRHLVDKKLVPVNYTMPVDTLQSMDNIEKLPLGAPYQLLKLAKIAYDGLLDEDYMFTDLGIDHLGIMKRSVSLDNVQKGPTYTFSFLHLTLQEYLCALHMSLVLTLPQHYDALMCKIVQRHLANNKLVSTDYRMLHSLQSMKDIKSLPTTIAKQLIELTRMAYEDRLNAYVLITLDTNHLGLYSLRNVQLELLIDHDDFIFLNSGVQKYLSALHMSLQGLSSFDNQTAHVRWHHDLCLPLPWHCSRVILKFLAGLCQHSLSFSCEQLGDLVVSMDNNGFHIAECAYESDRIVLESQELQKLMVIPSTHGNGNSIKTIEANAKLPFDYYLIGHCICHRGGLWSISINDEHEANFLIQGLQYSNRCIGKIHKLDLMYTFSSLPVQVLLREHVLHLRLNILGVQFTASSIDMLHDISNGTSMTLQLVDCGQVELLLPIVLGLSSLDRLTIFNYNSRASTSLQIDETARNLLLNNTNLKQLGIYDYLRYTCANASLNYIADLALMSIKILKSINHRPLQEFKILYMDYYAVRKTLFEVKLIKDAESNSVYVTLQDSFSSLCQFYGRFNIAQQILVRIPEQFHNVVTITNITIDTLIIIIHRQTQ